MSCTARAVAGEVTRGGTIALILNREFRGRRFVTSILLLPMMATPVAIAMVWLLMYEPTAGVLNFASSSLHLPTPIRLAVTASVLPALALLACV